MERELNETVKLVGQDVNFALDKSRPAAGLLHIKTEGERAVITVRAENLRPAKPAYKLFFVGRKEGTSVYKLAGDITPDEQGRAVLRIEVDIDDVDGEGTNLSCFYIFMIAATGRPMKPVLKGDLVTGKSDTPVQRSTGDYCDYYREYVYASVSELIAAAQSYTEIEPFGRQWLADRWWRCAEIIKLPVASIGARSQIEKYGHFIFAFNDEHFLLGVPGRHNDDEWPDRGRSGFLMWQSIKGSDEFGYWCMVIRRETGSIISIEN